MGNLKEYAEIEGIDYLISKYIGGKFLERIEIIMSKKRY